MTRKTRDVLLGGQPRARSAPPGTPTETRFLGRRESVSAETLNRGMYAVAEQVDEVFSEFLRLARKAVTRASQIQFDTSVAPTNYFEQTRDEAQAVSAYSGLAGDSASRLMDVFRPSTGSQYQENPEGAFTIYRVSAGLVVTSAGVPQIAFQIRTQGSGALETNYTGLASIRFTDAGAGALAIVTTVTGDDLLIEVTYDGTNPAHDFASLAALINADGDANTRVIAVAPGAATTIASHAAYNPCGTLGAVTVDLAGKGSVDTRVEAILIDDPISGQDIGVPDRCLVSFNTGLQEFTLVTGFSGGSGSPIGPGDYVLISAHSPSQNNNGYISTGRHQVVRVAQASATAYAIGNTFTFDGDFTLLTDLGLGDPDIYFLLSRYEARFWAVGHQHYFDKDGYGGEQNPLPFQFGADDNVHWFQGPNGIPAIDFSTDKDSIIRVANFSSVLADPGTILRPDQFVSQDINAEFHTGLALYSAGPTNVNLLVRPRFAGSGTGYPRLSLADIRFVVSAPLAVTTTVSISQSGSVDPSVAFDTSPANVRTANLEKVGVLGTYHVYRIDPFSSLNGVPAYAPLPVANDKFFYRVSIVDSVGAEAGKLLHGVYFSGAHSGCPVIRFKPGVPGARKFVMTDVETWLVHEVGDTEAGIAGITADLYMSTTGLANSFVKIASDQAMTVSHLVSRGVIEDTYAYRAQFFPEGYDIVTDAGLEAMYFMVHVKQPGTASLHRRVVKVFIADAQRSSDSQIGSFIGKSMCGVTENPAALTRQQILTQASVVVNSGAHTFTDAGAAFAGPQVQAGDWLVIRAGNNEGCHRINTVAPTVLTVDTPTALLTSETVTIDYAIFRGGYPDFPAGVQGGSQRFVALANADVTGIGGLADLGIGAFARFIDIPPDAFRSSAGSFADMSFLTAKVAEIMGTPVSDAVPAERKLTGLDARISEIESVSIGLGVPGSLGKYNVSDFANINNAIAAALAALPTGGTIVFKDGIYGSGPGSNVWALDQVFPADITLRAENPGLVEFQLTGITVKVQSRSQVRGIGISSTGGSGTIAAPQNALWVAGSGAGIQDIALVDVWCQGTARILIGEGVAGSGYLTQLVQGLTIDRLDARSCTVDPVVTNVDYGMEATAVPNPAAAKLRGLVLRDVQQIPDTLYAATTGIRIANADVVRIENIRARFQAYWSSNIVADGGYIDAGEFVTCSGLSLGSGTEFSTSDANPALWFRPAVSGVSSGLAIHGAVRVYQRTDTALTHAGLVLVGNPAQPGFTTTRVLASDIQATLAPGSFAAQNAVLAVVGALDGLIVNDVETSGNSVLRIRATATAVVRNVVTQGLRARGQAGAVPATATLDLVSSPAGNITGVQATGVQGLTTHVDQNRIAILTGVNQARLVGVQSDSATLGRIALTSCNQVGLGAVDLGTSGQIVQTGCTGVTWFDVRSLERYGFRTPAGRSYAADQPAGTANGDEILKFGIGAATTLRLWRQGSATYLTQNIASMTLPLPAGPVVLEDPAQGAAILEIGATQGFTALYTCAVAATVPVKVWETRTGVMTALTDAKFLMAAQQLGFGSSGISIDTFTDAVVLSTNLNLAALDHGAPYLFSNWSKANTSYAAAAIVFLKSTGAPGAAIRVYQIPVSVVAPFDPTLYQAFGTGDAGLELYRGIQNRTTAFSPAYGYSQYPLVKVGGAPLYAHSQAPEFPGFIIPPASPRGMNPVLTFGDELSYVTRRVSGAGVASTPVGTGTPEEILMESPETLSWDDTIVTTDIEIDVTGLQIDQNLDPVFRPAVKFRGSSAAQAKISGIQVSVQTTSAALTPVSSLSAVNLQAMLGQDSSPGAHDTWFLPAFSVLNIPGALTTDQIVAVQVRIAHAQFDTGFPLNVERVLLYHGSAPAVRNLCPTWGDLGEIRSIVDRFDPTTGHATSPVAVDTQVLGTPDRYLRLSTNGGAIPVDFGRVPTGSPAVASGQRVLATIDHRAYSITPADTSPHWYRVATVVDPIGSDGRGNGQLRIAVTGGNTTPVVYVLEINNDWSTGCGFSLLAPNSVAGLLTGVRVGKASAGNLHVDIRFAMSSGAASFSFSAISTNNSRGAVVLRSPGDPVLPVQVDPVTPVFAYLAQLSDLNEFGGLRFGIATSMRSDVDGVVHTVGAAVHKVYQDGPFRARGAVSGSGTELGVNTPWGTKLGVTYLGSAAFVGSSGNFQVRRHATGVYQIQYPTGFTYDDLRVDVQLASDRDTLRLYPASSTQLDVYLTTSNGDTAFPVSYAPVDDEFFFCAQRY